MTDPGEAFEALRPLLPAAVGQAADLLQRTNPTVRMLALAREQAMRSWVGGRAVYEISDLDLRAEIDASIAGLCLLLAERERRKLQ